MHPKHVEYLKSRLKDHNVGPFEDSSTTCVRTGLESNFRALQVLFLNHFHTLNLNHTLNHIFIPSITSMPLSIASADSSSYQSDKAGFRIMLWTHQTQYLPHFPIPKRIVDEMPAMRSIKPRSTYMQWFFH